VADQPDNDVAATTKPVGYWVVKIVVSIAIAVLGGLSLFTAADVPTTVYIILAGIAGVPDAAALGRRD